MKETIERLTTDYKNILSYTLTNVPDEERGIGLYTGMSGEILLLVQEYLNSKNEDILNRIHDHLDYCIEYFSSGKYLPPTLSAGVAGFGWIVDYLLQHDIIDADSADILDLIDPILLKELESLLADGNNDLLNGAMGIGVYFVRRKNQAAVEKILHYLDRNKIENGNEFLWKINKFNPHGKVVYDFGLAHGSAGTLYFLSKCYSKGVQQEKCLELIRGILFFYENNVQNYEEVGSYFPNLILTEDYFSEETTSVKSRVAWCYGDLGILYSILQTALLIGDTQLEKETISKLLITSKRKEVSDAMVYDAGFCHGTSGIAFLYFDLFLKTNIPEFEEVSLYWLAQTLAHNKGEDGAVSGYGFFGSADPSEPLKACDTLLEGLTGVGITYSFFLNRKSCDFSDGLMLG